MKYGNAVTIVLCDMSFYWKHENNGNQVTNCLSILKNTRLDINWSEMLFRSICALLYDVISIFCLSFLPFLDMLLYYCIIVLIYCCITLLFNIFLNI